MFPPLSTGQQSLFGTGSIMFSNNNGGALAPPVFGGLFASNNIQAAQPKETSGGIFGGQNQEKVTFQQAPLFPKSDKEIDA